MMGGPAGAIEAARAKRELAEEKVKTEGEDPSLKNVLTTGNLNRTKAAISATADDINTLVPATDKAGKALTDNVIFENCDTIECVNKSKAYLCQRPGTLSFQRIFRSFFEYSEYFIFEIIFIILLIISIIYFNTLKKYFRF
jgi:hypothetical protein